MYETIHAMDNDLPSHETIKSVVSAMSAHDVSLAWLKSACRSALLEEGGSRDRLYARLRDWMGERGAERDEQGGEEEEAIEEGEENGELSGAEGEGNKDEEEGGEEVRKKRKSRRRHRSLDLSEEGERERGGSSSSRALRRQRLDRERTEDDPYYQALWEQMQAVRARLEDVTERLDSSGSDSVQQLSGAVREAVNKELRRYPDFHFMPHLQYQYDRLKTIDARLRGLAGLDPAQQDEAFKAIMAELQQWGGELILEQEGGPEAAAQLRASYDGSFMEGMASKLNDARKRAYRAGWTPLTSHTVPVGPRFRPQPPRARNDACWTCGVPGHTKYNCPLSPTNNTERYDAPRLGPAPHGQSSRGRGAPNNRSPPSAPAPGGSASH